MPRHCSQARHDALRPPVSFSSRMLASTRGMPVLPSRQRSNSFSSFAHSTRLPLVPCLWKMREPCFTVKNLRRWLSTREC